MLDSFEEEKIDLKNLNIDFQRKLKKDIHEMNKSDMIWIRIDKSRNIYKISPSEYNRIFHNKITETYKIDNYDTINQINKDITRIANKLNIKKNLVN